jgi:Na+/melibiose symporter-like transporter
MLQTFIDICFGVIGMVIIILFTIVYQNITGENAEFAWWIVNTMISIIVVLRQFKRNAP